jgi:hypothetical protein
MRMSAGNRRVEASACVGLPQACRMTRTALMTALADSQYGERPAMFRTLFRRAADGSALCATCGLSIGHHADRDDPIVAPAAAMPFPTREEVDAVFTPPECCIQQHTSHVGASSPAIDERPLLEERPLLLAAEAEIKKHTGMDIEVETAEVPDSWRAWMSRTGINSIANEDTWAFLEDNQWNQRKIELWKKRGLKKIILAVWETPDEDEKWVTAFPEWETDSTTLKIWFYPRAGNWESSNSWLEPGYKRWWNLSDEIVFGLQLYQLPGKCFYKSDWLDDFEDVDPDSIIPNGTKKYKRWFQFRHWIIYWYPESMWGWNWAYTKSPPKLPDGSLFNLDAVLSCPSLPDFTMPRPRLPSLPDVSLPDVSLPSLPSISAPSISAPSLSAPSLGSLPSMPDRKARPTGTYACHGFIELTDLKVKDDGDKVILSNATVMHFWQDKNGYIDTEKKERQRMVLKTTSKEQAESWKLSLMESGVEEGDAGGCCTVA